MSRFYCKINTHAAVTAQLQHSAVRRLCMFSSLQLICKTATLALACEKEFQEIRQGQSTCHCYLQKQAKAFNRKLKSST